MARKNLSADKSGKVSSSTTSVCEKKEEEKTFSESEKQELFDNYHLTGDFEKDFITLSNLSNVKGMNVTLRPKHISSEATSAASFSKYKKSSQGEITSLFRTFTVSSDDQEYFKRKIQIDVEEDSGRVKEMYIRGWMLSKSSIDVMTMTLPVLDKLTVVDFWNTGLTDETLKDLSVLLEGLPSLRTLKLDGNSQISGQRFDILLSEKITVQQLSLRSCGIIDGGALFLAEALRNNKHLVSLNLSTNKLTDVAANHLANALQLNRSLLSLNLTNNTISDTGVKKIAEAVSTFALSHELVVARRMQQCVEYTAIASRTNSDLNDADRLATSSRSFGKDAKKTKKKETPNNKLGKDANPKKGPLALDETKVPKKGKGKEIKTPINEPEEQVEAKPPLLEKVTNINNELWIPGNRTLINLNLSFNQITEVGLQAMHEAVKYQVKLQSEQLKQSTAGLMRISMHGNMFNSSCAMFTQFTDLMKTRDPFYVPAVPSCIEETKDE